jgi:hypothetical protein
MVGHITIGHSKRSQVNHRFHSAQRACDLTQIFDVTFDPWNPLLSQRCYPIKNGNFMTETQQFFDNVLPYPSRPSGYDDFH